MKVFFMKIHDQQIFSGTNSFIVFVVLMACSMKINRFWELYVFVDVLEHSPKQYKQRLALLVCDTVKPV
jgi:hypothetical protein